MNSSNSRKEKWKQFFKKNRYLLIPFLLPMGLMLLGYLILGIWPIGNKSVMVLDLSAQYVHYFDALRDMFAGEQSILYSWSRTLGGEMLGIASYYLMSPFLLIVLLFPKVLITEAILVMTLLKVGAASVTMSIYLRKSRNATDKQIILFSLMYALMSYIVVHVMNIMWLDCVILLPLIVYYTERLILENRFIGLTVTLFLSFVSNYYIAYMMGIFTFVYFLYFCLAKWEKKTFQAFLGRLFKFMGSAVLAALCAALVIFCTWYSLNLGKLEFTDPDFTPKSQFTLAEFFGKTLPASYDTVRRHGMPFVYSSLLSFFLILLYYCNGKIKWKDKLLSALFFVAMIACMKISTTDIMMHGFQVPNWLNFRYSFVFSFFAILIAFESFQKIRYVKKLPLGLVYFLMMAGLVYLGFRKPDYLNIAAFLTSFVILTAYIILFTQWNDLKLPKKLFGILAMVLVVELTTNIIYTFYAVDFDVYYNRRATHRTLVDDTLPFVRYLDEYDKGFYRVEKTYLRTANDPLSLNMRGISHSSSAPNKEVLYFLEQFGYRASSNKSEYKKAVPLQDSLFDIKYILSKEMLYGDFTPILEEGEITVYENNSNLSVGYMVDSRFMDFELSGNPFENQNRFVSLMLGRDVEVYKPIYSVKKDLVNLREQSAVDQYKYSQIDADKDAVLTYELTVPKDRIIYYHLGAINRFPVEVSLDGEFLEKYFDSNSFISPLGRFSDGTAALSLKLTEDRMYVLKDGASFYYLDETVLQEVIDELKDELWEITEWSNTMLKGTVTAKEDGLLFTSIPYETGWQIYVDGEKVTAERGADAFLALPLSKGEHKIEMRFMPREVILGSVVSLFGILLFLILSYFSVRRRRLKYMVLTLTFLNWKKEQEACRIKTFQEEQDALKGEEDIES